MIFGKNTTRDISKLPQISLALQFVKLRITISYLCQISLQIMQLPISTNWMSSSFLKDLQNLRAYCGANWMSSSSIFVLAAKTWTKFAAYQPDRLN